MPEKQTAPEGSATNWPRVIFVDTNALYSLGPQFEQVDFANLLELRKYLDFEISVPRVSWLEFLRHRRVALEAFIHYNNKHRSHFRKLELEMKHLVESENVITTFAKRIDEHFQAKADGCGIKVLPLPEIDVNRLLEMAVERQAPFQESGEKGFRDTLILFTCMEAIRKRPDLNAIAITNDQLLAKSLAQFSSEFETRIDVVSGFAEAVTKMLNIAEERYRKRRRREALETKELLLKYRKNIEAKLADIKEFSQWEISGFNVIENVQDILSLTFKDIESAVVKEQGEDSTRILFSLRCDLGVRVSQSSWDMLNPKFQIGGGKVPPTSFFAPEVMQEKTVEKMLYGEASFIAKDGTLQLTELRVDKMLPTEDLAKLIQIDVAA